MKKGTIEYKVKVNTTAFIEETNKLEKAFERVSKALQNANEQLEKMKEIHITISIIEMQMSWYVKLWKKIVGSLKSR